MPGGIYLNAGDLEPYKLARIMNDIINDKNRYYEFFKWHNHYSFHATDRNGYHEAFCSLCALINNRRNQTSILDYITDWWNEEQPIYPTTVTNPPEHDQNAVEKFMTNLFDVLDPSSDD